MFSAWQLATNETRKGENNTCIEMMRSLSIPRCKIINILNTFPFESFKTLLHHYQDFSDRMSIFPDKKLKWRNLSKDKRRECLWKVVDPGFFPREAPTPKVGVLNLLFCKFLPKTAWKWKNLDPEEARVPGAPPAPLGSANWCSIILCHGVRGFPATASIDWHVFRAKKEIATY